jgi:hypothetical protein
MNGQRNGYGVFYYANGSKYQGLWKNNLKDGLAIFIEDSGNITQGKFSEDRLVKEVLEEKEKEPPQNNAKNADKK